MTATATHQPTTDVVVHGTRLPLTERARARWDTDSLKLLAASKAKGADVAMLFTLAELSARYDLDPWANEIWVASMGGRDGGAGSLAIMVGRDGYMKVAKRDGRFVTCSGAAVYEKDDFEAEYVDEQVGWKVTHKITSVADRGEPKGAWATLVREGRPTLFFFARLEQFKRNGGAWKYEDAMILKCAQSYLLRTTYNVSGPAPADELMVGFEADSIEGSAVEAPRTRIALPEAIAGLFARAEDLDPLSWRRNEVEARVFGGDGAVLLDEVRRVKIELEAWLEKNEPKDADVVDERPAAAPARMDVDADTGEVLEPDDADEPLDEPEPDKLGAIPPSEPDDGPSDGVPVPPPVGDAAAGEWYRDTSRKAAERYVDDVGFRQQVDELVLRRDDLETSADEADDRTQIDAELDVIDETLERLGVPRGWRPPSQAGEGQEQIDF